MYLNFSSSVRSVLGFRGYLSYAKDILLLDLGNVFILFDALSTLEVLGLRAMGLFGLVICLLGSLSVG